MNLSTLSAEDSIAPNCGLVKKYSGAFLQHIQTNVEACRHLLDMAEENVRRLVWKGNGPCG
jgi:hypothetical protein